MTTFIDLSLRDMQTYTDQVSIKLAPIDSPERDLSIGVGFTKNRSISGKL